MKVKKYKAPTMPEAMMQIRRDLGGDAIILNTREVESGGFLGFFVKKHLEVVAAVDPDALSNHSIAQTSSARPKAETMSVNVMQEQRVPVEPRPLQNHQPVRDVHVVQGASYPGPLQGIQEWLRAQEVEESMVEALMKPLMKEWYMSDETLQKEQLLKALNDVIEKRLNEKALPELTYEKKYLLLAGPTGVGKTTTLAKLAAKAKLEDQKKIAFITADTYRIAAVDQLKAYADILDVPIEVAYSKEDFLNAKKHFADCDLVFVDTAGRNFRETSFIDELKQLIPFGEDMETWLVLSLTAKYKDLRAVYDSFKGLQPKRSILTKIDETESYGAIFNFWMKDGMAPAYLTNGQNVPDDLIPVTTRKIADLLSGVKGHA